MVSQHLLQWQARMCLMSTLPLTLIVMAALRAKVKDLVPLSVVVSELVAKISTAMKLSAGSDHTFPTVKFLSWLGGTCCTVIWWLWQTRLHTLLILYCWLCSSSGPWSLSSSVHHPMCRCNEYLYRIHRSSFFDWGRDPLEYSIFTFFTFFTCVTILLLLSKDVLDHNLIYDYMKLHIHDGIVQ